MTGGASGNEPVVAPALEASTRATLTETLAPDLEAAIKAQVPEGYVLLSGATASTYTPLPAAPSEESGKADIRVQGTIRAVVFPSTSLAKAIARKTLQNTYRDESVTIADTSTLSLSTENALPQQGDDSFTFTLSGSAELLYSVIPSRIASAIAGKTRAEAEAALASYPEVKRATLILRPFWRTAFPEDPAAIKVTVPGAAGN
jgi:hypothetical protein